MTVIDEIRTKLTRALSPKRLEIVDESHLHVGHSGAPSNGESHFRVFVVTSAFNGITRVERQRMVYRVLARELQGPIHALSLATLTPDEDKSEP